MRVVGRLEQLLGLLLIENRCFPFLDDELGAAHGVGRPIVVRLPGETLRGTFSALDENGALKLELAGGGERLVTGGEVYFGRGGETQPAQNGAQG